MAKKKGLVRLTEGTAFAKDSKGKRIGFKTLQEALDYEAKCHGTDSCTNKTKVYINDGAGTGEYPATVEYVLVGTDVILRITYDLGAGPVVKELTFV